MAGVYDPSLSIAVVDDEPQVRRALGRLLGSHGHAVELFADGRSLLEAFALRRFDCVVLDLHMPELSGFQLLQEISKESPHPAVILITGKDEPGNDALARSLGAAAYLKKPVDADHLLAALPTCQEQRISGPGIPLLNEGCMAASSGASHTRPVQDFPSHTT